MFSVKKLGYNYPEESKITYVISESEYIVDERDIIEYAKDGDHLDLLKNFANKNLGSYLDSSESWQDVMDDALLLAASKKQHDAIVCLLNDGRTDISNLEPFRTHYEYIESIQSEVLGGDVVHE